MITVEITNEIKETLAKLVEKELSCAKARLARAKREKNTAAESKEQAVLRKLRMNIFDCDDFLLIESKELTMDVAMKVEAYGFDKAARHIKLLVA